MKRLRVIFPVIYIALCIPAWVQAQSYPSPAGEIFRQEGIASWYGPEFDGRPTASGEIFNSAYYTAAHPTLPFGTVLVVTNRHNNRQVMVTVNDRGPFVAARIIDVSKAAAEQLDMLITGTAPVLIESVNRIVIPNSSWSLPPPSPPVLAPAPPAPAPAPPAPVPAPPAPANSPAVSPPLPVPQYQPPPNSAVTLIPPITPLPNKVYRLQVGSYRIARNAVDAFEKLKNTGLNPAYERNGDYYRVVLAGIRGNEVQSVADKLGSAGFLEVLIREEN
ncbi:MAG: septal ring lytic transglycosylase RlpA family protein [Treponema sp.]|jgi:rare lipoprotein A|nr:septal ring lytic transglycosylase RlpA family protein [Treponema sp.]